MNSSFDSAASLWIHLHWLFAIVALFGFIAALVWLFRYMDKEQIKKTAIVALLIGVIGAILTAPMAMFGMQHMLKPMMFNHDFSRGVGADSRNFGGRMMNGGKEVESMMIEREQRMKNNKDKNTNAVFKSYNENKNEGTANTNLNK